MKKDENGTGAKKPPFKTSADKLFDENANGKDRSSIARIRGYLLAGILVTAPITITVYLTYIFLSFVDTKVGLILPDEWYRALYGHTTIPGIGLIVAITFFVCVGWLATNFLGRIVIMVSEKILARMPIIRTIYGATKQVLETVMTSQSNAFREVVMFEYPRKGIWSVGFVTGTSEGEVQEKTEQETMNIFLPTTPNPTSGFLLFIPRKDLIFMEMTVEEGIKLVVSGGMISPDPSARHERKRLRETGEGISANSANKASKKENRKQDK
ncbi:MAG: DUF502 domain-containing protein [Alphaproteobacteria bacterium]|nr:DUF502 domain-containing protein [Alphaproteobacteria bacterium]MCB9974002.1 DUF502 domain-containing protein [Rhodospirillales bacterium]